MEVVDVVTMVVIAPSLVIQFPCCLTTPLLFIRRASRRFGERIFVWAEAIRADLKFTYLISAASRRAGVQIFSDASRRLLMHKYLYRGAPRRFEINKYFSLRADLRYTDVLVGCFAPIIFLSLRLAPICSCCGIPPRLNHCCCIPPLMILLC